VSGRTPLDRATITLGLASLATVLFTFVRGDLELVTVRGGGVVVAGVLGVLATAAGWLGSRPLTVVAGAVFLAAAATLLVLLGTRGNGGFLGGSASTFALWLGLGLGLVITGTTERTEQG
jgi:hypothetical protein